MSVAPINKVAEVVDYAKTELPADKLIMGIPNYAYDWTLPFVRGDSKAKSLGNIDAIELATMYNAEILFDEEAQSPYFYYTDNEDKQHIVHFEDARSIYTKMMLAFENKLYGVSIWNLMRQFPQLWLVINENFNILKIYS